MNPKDVELYNKLKSLQCLPPVITEQDQPVKVGLKHLTVGWMSPAFITGNKQCIRKQNWSLRDIASFKENSIVIVKENDNSEELGLVRLTVNPYLENSANAPNADYDNEGMEYMEQFTTESLYSKWIDFKNSKKDVYVFRFEVVHLFCNAFLERAAILEFEANFYYKNAEYGAYLLTY